ncbi:hypothetical protein [Aequorivita marina]|uniref:hypothetical protein n=1 Tax=Aequorivita marina TaxID=3073654 RepID=UPI002874BCA6|nr:hypothetical protein [Aequorivita sp. S2608]MDS1297557.1 hypothetical protein [Aequorivita sp. S2608]
MSTPINCITVAEARELQDNWVATRAKTIEQAQGYKDSREFLFSVAELEEFLEYIKKQSDSTSPPGVRIYFGAYDNDASNKATVFLVPTNGTSLGAENNYSLRPLNQGLTGFPPVIY